MEKIHDFLTNWQKVGEWRNGVPDLDKNSRRSDPGCDIVLILIIIVC